MGIGSGGHGARASARARSIRRGLLGPAATGVRGNGR